MSRFWSCDDAEGLRTPLISWGIWGFQVSSCFRHGWWSSYLSPTTKESVRSIAWIQTKHPSLPHIDLEWNPHHPSSTLINPSLWSIYPRTGYPKITSTRYDATSSSRITLDPLDLPVICISYIYQSNLVFQLDGEMILRVSPVLPATFPPMNRFKHEFVRLRELVSRDCNTVIWSIGSNSMSTNIQNQTGL